ncbi:expressed unknown protein [Seminavis robusta]|uniref:Uncharacterized protein n=1 Tax=Seminavis robusta TaxID=568900 RepID=A0A9N8HQE0_9STRA|nr:expressed unknown protein [Seminavis robusta]|eukprot:Sro1432_g272140.1 n/a (123) ;mRNA; r:20698-21066
MQQIVQYTVLALIVLGLCLLVVLSPMMFAKKTDTTYLQGSYHGTGTGRDDHHNSPSEHTRPMCQDSTFFRAEFDGEKRSCAWVSHKPIERCNVFGTDNHGNEVPAKEACFEACDTGNCRRRK